MGGAKQQCEGTCDGFTRAEFEEAQEPKANQCRKNTDQNIRRVGDKDVSDRRVGAAVTCENWQLLDICPNNVRRQQ